MTESGEFLLADPGAPSDPTTWPQGGSDPLGASYVNSVVEGMMLRHVPVGPPVTHWTPEEEFYAECGGGQEGDFATLNSDKVTCPGCRAAIDEAEGPGSMTTTATLADRLDEIGALERGWLNGDGEPVTAEAMACARRVLPSMAAGSWGRPRIYPTPEGGIQAEWSFTYGETCIVFAPDGSMTREGPQS